MKYIKTFENHRQSEKLDEGLKSVIAGALLSLSTIISSPVKGQNDLLDPTNPIGLTNPASPLSLTNPNSPMYGGTRDPDDGPTSYDVNKIEILQELDKIDIKDTTLIKVKSLIEKEPESKEDFNQILELLKEFAQNKGYADVLPIIEEISKIDIDKLNDVEYKEDAKKRLQKIIIDLKEMRNYTSEQDILLWFFIGLIILAVSPIVYLLWEDLRY